MAIEIVPKPKKDFKLNVSFFDALYYIVLFSFFIVLAFYLALVLVDRRLAVKMEEINTAIIEKDTQEVRDLEENIADLKLKVDAFSDLAKERRINSSFFSFFSRRCHKKVYFPEIRLNTEESWVELTGNAQDFAALKEQIYIFKQEDLIRNITLSRASIGENGGVIFDISLALDPQVFK